MEIWPGGEAAQGIDDCANLSGIKLEIISSLSKRIHG